MKHLFTHLYRQALSLLPNGKTQHLETQPILYQKSIELHICFIKVNLEELISTCLGGRKVYIFRLQTYGGDESVKRRQSRKTIEKIKLSFASIQ